MSAHDHRCQPRLNELLGCSPQVGMGLGRLQPRCQQLLDAANERGASIATVAILCVCVTSLYRVTDRIAFLLALIIKNMSRPPFPKTGLSSPFSVRQTPPLAPQPVPVLGMSAAVRGEARARAFVRDHRVTLSEWERSSRARHQPGWLTAAEPDRTLELVREMPDPLFGLCLSGMLPDLAMWCLYGDLV